MPRWKDLGLGIWRSWRQLDWRPIRQQAESPSHITVLGAGPGEAVVRAVVGADSQLIYGPLDMPVPDPAPDLVVLAPSGADGLQAAAERARALVGRKAATLLILQPGTEAPDGLRAVGVTAGDSASEALVAAAIIDALPEDRRLAAARAWPSLRHHLSSRLVQETAFGNAQFALLTNLPSLLPGPGTAAGVAADVIILTTNQVVLVYRLAAAWGQPLEDSRRIILDVMPVVGSGFLWRTAARTLVGVLPPFAAVAPKVAVAFVGTYVVGRLATLYYERGLGPSSAQIRLVEAEARHALANVWTRLRPPESATAPSLPRPQDPAEVARLPHQIPASTNAESPTRAGTSDSRG